MSDEMEDEIVAAVDDIVEEVETAARREARRLGLDTPELMDRVANELKARTEDM